MRRLGFDIVIRKGRIYDGTGNSWFKADIGIGEGKITRLSRVPLKEADRVIDASGLVVSPGFINLHSHTDSTIQVHNCAENCLAMGLVTEGIGNCGSSSAPITEKYREVLRERMRGRALGEVEIDWLSLSEWLDRLEKRGIGINIAPYVGHGTVRASVMGPEGKGGERPTPTEEELEEMKSLVEGAMEDGAFGLSTGLIYAPGRNAQTEEIVDLCKVVARYGGIYASHIRNEGDRLIESVWEFLEICEKAGVRGTIAHHKAAGRNNFGKVNETLRLVDRARKRGIEVMIDQYPWRIGGTTKSLGSRFRDAAPNRKELLELLRDEKRWGKLKAEQKDRPAGGTIVGSRSHPELEGKTFEEAAEALGVEDVWEGIRRVLLDDEGYTTSGGIPFSEEDIITVMKHPLTAISTDQYAMDSSKVTLSQLADDLSIPHPRGWGTYPKFLGKYVREEGVLTLEDAIRKVTSLPAQFLGLEDRGLIKEGFWADIVIFDPEKVANRATYRDPLQYPVGIPWVIVNGRIAVDEGRHTGALAGRVLRHRAQ
ncbi:MAG: amidohydrolase family protein [Candidatus Bathyarchaeia archaeon]